MAVSVVSTMRATDAALSTADRVTLTGSMTPSAARSPYFSVAAFSPWPTGSSATLLTATAPSRPALVAIQYSGALSALENTSTPAASSPESDARRSASALRACNSADPPPATMPSSTAALAAATASSTLSLRSLSSVSAAAPTLMTATPPASLARRSSTLSRCQSESVLSISARNCLARFVIASSVPPPSTITVSSLLTTTRRAEPSTSSPTSRSVRPASGLTTWPPVTIAKSSRNALRRSPKNGALTATAFSVLRIALTTSVDKGSPSTSSAITSSGLPASATFSNSGRKSGSELILSRCNRIRTSSSTACCASKSVTKYADRKPLSKPTPSVNSSSVLSVDDSSTLTTPSWPTLVIASPTSSPICSSRDDTVATWAMPFWPDTGGADASSASDNASAALPIPKPSAIGLAPAATLRRPPLMIACASTVAVVVPSPATSLVLVATDLTNWAPKFSKGSSRSISRATVTPSLVTVGPPKALASTTCRPRGPRVTRTASASLSTPASIARRAVSLNSICLLISLSCSLRKAVRPGKSPTRRRGDCRGGTRFALLGDDGQHVAGRQDQVLLAVVLDLGAAVLAVDDGVALGHVQRNPLRAIVVPPAGTDGDDGAFLRLLLGGVGNDQTRCGRGLGLVGLYEDLVLEWLDVHARHDWSPPLGFVGRGPGAVAPNLGITRCSAFVRALASSSRVPAQGFVRLPPSTLYMRVLALKVALLLPGRRARPQRLPI